MIIAMPICMMWFVYDLMILLINDITDYLILRYRTQYDKIVRFVEELKHWLIKVIVR